MARFKVVFIPVAIYPDHASTLDQFDSVEYDGDVATLKSRFTQGFM